MSKLGRMRWRVTIEREQITADSSGGGTATWNSVATVWAEVKPMSSTERSVSGKREAYSKYKIRMRSRSDLTEADRLRVAGKLLNITGIEDSDEMIPRWTIVYAEEGGPQ